MNFDNQSKPTPASDDYIESKLLESAPRGGAEVGTPPRLVVDERVRLMRDGVLNNASLILSGLISIVIVPVMLKGLGPTSTASGLPLYPWRERLDSSTSASA